MSNFAYTAMPITHLTRRLHKVRHCRVSFSSSTSHLGEDVLPFRFQRKGSGKRIYVSSNLGSSSFVGPMNVLSFPLLPRS
jgi:hypothetical protein